MEISKKRILDAAWQADIDGDNIRWDYSGRFMYNKTTWGIVGSLQDFTKFIVSLMQTDYVGPELAWELAQAVSTDSMAFDTIFYFPGVTVTEDGSDEYGADEDDDACPECKRTSGHKLDCSKR